MKRRRTGTATIDFALTSALGFIPLMFGMMEYSWFYFQQLQARSACRDVMRMVATIPLDQDPVAAAEARVVDALADKAVQGSPNVAAYVTGDPPVRIIEMTVRINYQPLIGLVPTPRVIETAWSARLEDQSED